MAWLGSQQAREEREPWSGGELVVDELASARARGGPDVSGGSAYPEVRQDPDAAFRDAMEAQCGGWRTLVTRTSG